MVVKLTFAGPEWRGGAGADPEHHDASLPESGAGGGEVGWSSLCQLSQCIHITLAHWFGNVDWWKGRQSMLLAWIRSCEGFFFLLDRAEVDGSHFC